LAIELVSAHATSTPFNDAMESRAIAQVFADRPAPIVHPMKAQIGHTLGAAGVLEALGAMDAIACGVVPAAAGSGELDPDATALLLERGEARPLSGALKLSAAFGGANAALVLTDRPSGRRPRALRAVRLRAHAHVEDADLVALSEATGVARDRLARLDPLCRLGLAAVTALAASVGRETLRGAGVVAGHALATIDTNALFDARKRSRGATAVEPRLFPATSPNAIAGECAIVYGLTGPGFAVSSGLSGSMEALRAAAELVAAGDAEQMIVIAADDAGPAARDFLEWTVALDRKGPFRAGAVALLLDGRDEPGIRDVPSDLPVDQDHAPIGHLALLRWLTS
jgi:3-oxoacyl-[acyl-carrier-protein] synthase-1/3-oxoacyl-[acyl-carrier-protein] synthase II